MPRTITDDERRARLAVRHRLTPTTACASVADATDAVGALHATDPVTVYLSLAARCAGATVADIDRTLYTDRLVLRMLGMRRTMFVVPVPLAPAVQAACSRAVASRERKKLLDFIAQTGFTKAPQRWLSTVETAALDVLRARDSATPGELAADVPQLDRKLLVGSGRWQAEQGAASRVLLLLAADGQVVRGQPRGSWVSTQYRWAATEQWLSPELAADMAQHEAAGARAELARRWLHAYGPGTLADLKWWAGWTVAETRRALAAAGAVEVQLSTGSGYLLPDDVEAVGAPEPWVALLPALDTTPMGWTSRDWFIGPHRPALFDRNGNIGPTVWSDGRVVGGWAQRPDGEVVFRLLEDIGAAASSAVERAAEQLHTWIGDTRFTPRFRTPLERELVS